MLILAGLAVVALLALLPVALLFSRLNARSAFAIGAPIVYRHEEVSTHPGPDARDIRPSTRGEFYYYSLINYLRVMEVLGDGRIIAVARDHKRVCLSPNDSQLRKARVLERLIFRRRFPHF